MSTRFNIHRDEQGGQAKRAEQRLDCCNLRFEKDNYRVVLMGLLLLGLFKSN